MIREERLARITKYVQNRRFASVDELVKAIGVSKATIRRDLAILNQSGAITLTRGGATSDAPHARNEEPSYNERAKLHPAEKDRIGRAAAGLLNPGMSIVLDTGTTTKAVLPYLRELAGINLVTNDIAIAADLAYGSHSINVTVTGGQLIKGFYALRGYAAEELVRSIHTDVAFLGFDKIDVHSGCYITNADEVSLKRCIIEEADKVVVLCDSSKFVGNSFISVCGFKDIDVVITNKETDPAAVQALRTAGVEVILT